MLDLALKAKVPLIHARTRDLPHFGALLSYLSSKKVVEVLGNLDQKAVVAAVENGLVMWTSTPVKNPNNLRRYLRDAGSTLVAVNQEHVGPEYFDAGPVAQPRGFIRDLLEKMGLEDDQVDQVLPAVGGLTAKQVEELVMLAQAQHGDLLREHVLDARRRCFSEVRGLQHVDTTLRYYWREPQIDDYLSWAGEFLLDSTKDERLAPRGLLLYGLPGTGKTTAAKHVAREIGVPLFRLDLGAVKGKYVGESEHALEEALAQVDREAPCVLLLDEVEKALSRGEDGGVTESLLASILWWLAEHRGRVLVVMTTNDAGKLPPELHRVGRLDQAIKLEGLLPDDAVEFYHQLVATFLDRPDEWPTRCYENTITQAEVESDVKEDVRDYLMR